MDTFSNVIQPSFEEVFGKDHRLKGQWRKVCFRNSQPLILELGCGKGEYTVGLARMFPRLNFVGIDIKGARMWRGAKTALEEGIENVVFLRTRIELINSFFDTGEVNEIWLTFPDPQPKKPKKRLSSSRFLNSYKLFLAPRGKIHLKTDNEMLFRYTLELIDKNNLLAEEVYENLYKEKTADPVLNIKTYYEKQFLEQGLPISYLGFRLGQADQIIEP